MSQDGYKPIDRSRYIEQQVSPGSPIPSRNSTAEYDAMTRETRRTLEFAQSETKKSLDSVQKDVRQFLPPNRGTQTNR